MTEYIYVYILYIRIYTIYVYERTSPPCSHIRINSQSYRYSIPFTYIPFTNKIPEICSCTCIIIYVYVYSHIRIYIQSYAVYRLPTFHSQIRFQKFIRVHVRSNTYTYLVIYAYILSRLLYTVYIHTIYSQDSRNSFMYMYDLIRIRI